MHDRLCVSWSSWHEYRGLAHVLVVWCVVYYLVSQTHTPCFNPYAYELLMF